MAGGRRGKRGSSGWISWVVLRRKRGLRPPLGEKVAAERGNAPSAKIQAPRKIQGSELNGPDVGLRFEGWCFSGAWRLGAWSFSYGAVLNLFSPWGGSIVRG